MPSLLAYRNLYGFLQKQKLLKAPANSFIPSDLRSTIDSLGEHLAAAMGQIEYRQVFEMTRRNTLVSTKVLLSIHRRTTRLFKFFEQGRVKHPMVTVDPLDDI